MIDRPLVLSVKRSAFRVDDGMHPRDDQAFQEVRPEVIARDEGCCIYCGFQSPKWQDVHHLDDDHKNNVPENLGTTCPLCHLPNHVGFAGVSGRGTLIYLDPDLGIRQSDLSHLVRTLWIAKRSDSKEFAQQATAILERMFKLNLNVRRVFGFGQASDLGEYLAALPERAYKRREGKLRGLYLLPQERPYTKLIDYWTTSVYHAVPASTWPKISHQYAKRLAENSAQSVEDFLDSIGK